MKFILRMILVGLSVWGISQLFPAIQFNDLTSAIIFVLLLTVLNVIVRPIFILLTLPVTILTLGLFLVFVNAIMILIADYFMGGFNVDGFWWAFIFSIIIAIVNWIVEAILGD